MEFIVYLAGEIHSNWREEIKEKTKSLKLPITFVGHEWRIMTAQTILVKKLWAYSQMPF